MVFVSYGFVLFQVQVQAHPLLPTAAAFVSYEFVLVRVRVGVSSSMRQISFHRFSNNFYLVLTRPGRLFSGDCNFPNMLISTRK
jgi:hypothetical protein